MKAAEVVGPIVEVVAIAEVVAIVEVVAIAEAVAPEEVDPTTFAAEAVDVEVVAVAMPQADVVE